MGAPVNLPFHRDGQHLAADEGEKISCHVEIEIGEPKCCVGIARRRTGWWNCRRRFVVIHGKMRAETRWREASVAPLRCKARGYLILSTFHHGRQNDETTGECGGTMVCRCFLCALPKLSRGSPLTAATQPRSNACVLRTPAGDAGRRNRSGACHGRLPYTCHRG